VIPPRLTTKERFQGEWYTMLPSASRAVPLDRPRVDGRRRPRVASPGQASPGLAMKPGTGCTSGEAR
jgi:hypothetical protein